MKKTLLLVAFAGIIFTQCGKGEDPFALKNGAVGPLTKGVQMRELDSIFATDSIVKLNPIENALGTQGEVEIYEKGGEKLLLISPEDEKDPNSLISNIQVFDARYKTEKGLSVTSTFADVKANYEITTIENAINAVVIFLKDTDMYLTIDKKQLPENIRYDYSAKIEASQIPDEATFKYFMIGWDTENE
ncbi:MAG: hypothetical protein R2781_08970 [Flavobacteriaceae bacterium]